MAKDKKEAKEKPLDKMTVKELREIAKEVEGVVGVHGMDKAELLSTIKEARGIKESPKKAGASNKELKAKIGKLKPKRREALEAKDKVLAKRFRRQIARLKKKTRQAA